MTTQRDAVGSMIDRLRKVAAACPLRRAIEAAWHSAEATRPELLESAANQIALSEAAYARLFQMVEARRPAARR